jgi:quercetin dioxygenase-like cupin family protein
MVVNSEVGARSMSVWTTFHQPGEVVPLHTHEFEEIITIVAGEAIMTVAGDPSRCTLT